MEFNEDKCKVLHLGVTSPLGQYHIEGGLLTLPAGLDGGSVAEQDPREHLSAVRTDGILGGI